MIAIGSSLSIRSFCRMGSTVSMFSASGDTSMHLGKVEFKHTYSTATLNIYNDGSRSLRLSKDIDGGGNPGGALHGTWTTEAAVEVSDRRLKVDILPLYQKLIEQYPRNSKKKLAVMSGDDAATKTEDGIQDQLLQVIRQLRPVAFKYKNNAESKFSHYGFIAQEIESVMPNVVSTIHGGKGPEFEKSAQKGIRHNDLIAVITLGLQSLDHRLLKLDKYLNFVQDKVDYNYVTLSTRLKTIEAIIKKVVKGKKIIKDRNDMGQLLIEGSGATKNATTSDVRQDQQVRNGGDHLDVNVIPPQTVTTVTTAVGNSADNSNSQGVPPVFRNETSSLPIIDMEEPFRDTDDTDATGINRQTVDESSSEESESSNNEIYV
jgi:hypothetical protein